MHRFSFRLFAALGLCAALAAGTAWAQAATQQKNGDWVAWQKAKEQQRQQSQQQQGVLYRKPVTTATAPARGPVTQPTGWDKGHKTGWGDCNVPPGHAKPAHCRPVITHRDRRHREARHDRRRWEGRREARRREERREDRREDRRREERREAWRTHRQHEKTEIARRDAHTRPLGRPEAKHERERHRN